VFDFGTEPTTRTRCSCRRAALMTAAARRRGSRGQSPLVGEAKKLNPLISFDNCHPSA